MTITPNMTLIMADGVPGAAPIGKFDPYWNPEITSWVLRHWDSDDIVNDGSGNMASWTDRIAGAVMTPVSGNVPTIAGSVNGHNTLTVAAGTRAVIPAMPYTDHMAFAAIIEISDNTTAQQDLWVTGASDPEFSLFSGAPRFYDGSNAVFSASALTTTAFHLLVGYFDSDSGYPKFRIDGADATGGTHVSGAIGTWTTSGTLGASASGSSPQTSTKIASLIWGQGQFSLNADPTSGYSSEILKLEGQQAQRYAITLPSGHPFKTVAPQRRN